MGTLSKLRTDRQLEKDGVWFEYDEGIQIKLARAYPGNKLYQRVLEDKTKPMRRAIQNDAVSANRLDEILQEVYLEVIILDWRNVFDDEEQPIPYSKELMKEEFKENPDLWYSIREDASKSGAFRKFLQEDTVKN